MGSDSSQGAKEIFIVLDSLWQSSQDNKRRRKNWINMCFETGQKPVAYFVGRAELM